jgi:hypothetical protein
MSENEQTEAEKVEADRLEASRRGHFESVLEDYPGYFELPFPFLDRHMKVWWTLAIDPLKSLTPLDFEYYDGEWKAAVALIKKSGKWAVDGVSKDDLDSDNVPSDVKAWVMLVGSLYIYPKLPISVQRKKFETM